MSIKSNNCKLTCLFSKQNAPVYAYLLVHTRLSAVVTHEFSLVTLPANSLNINCVLARGFLPVGLCQPQTSYAFFDRLGLKYFPGFLKNIQLSKTNTVTIGVGARDVLRMAMFLKYSWWCRMLILIDICANDYISRVQRFEVTYCFISVARNDRVYMRTFTDEITPLPSVSKLFNSAGWLEREAWDMYGVTFFGHADLRRILTDYGFLGFPLRKDFPLTGFFEIRYDDTQRQIIVESVNLIQELRLFFFSTVWVKL